MRIRWYFNNTRKWIHSYIHHKIHHNIMNCTVSIFTFHVLRFITFLFTILISFLRRCTPLDKINDTGLLFIIFSRFFPLLLFSPIKTICHPYFEGAGRSFYVSFISSIVQHLHTYSTMYNIFSPPLLMRCFMFKILYLLR